MEISHGVLAWPSPCFHLIAHMSTPPLHPFHPDFNYDCYNSPSKTIKRLNQHTTINHCEFSTPPSTICHQKLFDHYQFSSRNCIIIESTSYMKPISSFYSAACVTGCCRIQASSSHHIIILILHETNGQLRLGGL